jgi:NADPH:quinone reductase-like Zn-dependent oxidoreductase
VKKLESWEREIAADLAMAYTTMDLASAMLIKLKKGERVLILAVTGGVGLVAVQFTQRMGCFVYATAGKDNK